MTWSRAHHVPGFDVCFGAYLRGFLRRSFARIYVSGDALVPSGGYVAAANHNGWWDGLVPYYLHHRATAQQPFRLMMSEAELRRFPFFRLGGAFSVDATSVRSARDAIVYGGACAREGAAVWIYPEGRLLPPGAPLQFTSGFVHAARSGAVPIVPVALRYVMLAKERPEAFVAFGEAVDARGKGVRERVRRDVETLLARIDGDVLAQRFDRYTVALNGKAGADDTVGAVTGRIPAPR